LWPAVHDKPPYILRSLVVHSGEVGGGHYTAYIRAQDDSWYFCDDWQPPRPAHETEVLSAQAYLLFYER
jgi:ubiquitin C-terminal hydrolase